MVTLDNALIIDNYCANFANCGFASDLNEVTRPYSGTGFCYIFTRVEDRMSSLSHVINFCVEIIDHSLVIILLRINTSNCRISDRVNDRMKICYDQLKTPMFLETCTSVYN